MHTGIPIAKEPFSTALKRKKDSSKDSSTDDQLFQQDLLTLPQKLSNIEDLIQSNRLCDNEKFNDLLSAVSNLTKVVSEKLDTIISLLKTPTKSYSDNIVTKTVPDNSTVLEKLRDLKNARNSSAYKLSYNNSHKEIYSSGLAQTPQLVPRKLHEIINSRDSEEMQRLKKRRTIRKVEDEIETLSYHAKIHESKIMSIDVKANNLLNTIQNDEERSRISKKWRQLITFGQEAIEIKWKQKRIFLQSDKHLIALGNKYRDTGFSFASNGLPQTKDRVIQDNHAIYYQPSQQSSSATPQDVDMDAEWTEVRNSKNGRRQQRSPRLNQCR